MTANGDEQEEREDARRAAAVRLFGKEDRYRIDAFVDGARWADAHPVEEVSRDR